MAVPSSIADLNTTAASNSPGSGESPGGGDDHIRALAAIIKQNASSGSDIASANSITVPSAGSYFAVTGTTTITSIADAWNGRMVALKFSGALTLTHSSGLILPGAANITTASGDAGLFVNESTGVWRCIVFERANGSVVLASGTANGVAYLNASKVLTTGSAFQFDGTNLSLASGKFQAYGGTNLVQLYHSGTVAYIETGGGASTPIGVATAGTERWRVDTSGNWLLNATSGTWHKIFKNQTNDAGNIVLEIASTTGNTTAAFYAVTAFGANAANAALKVGKDGVSSRSINAGGTVNASGADYAEYMRKAAAHLLHTFAKGDIVGINGSGELTPRFAEAISFAVKSTDPSLVGGDVWGSEDVVGKRPQEPVKIDPGFPAKPEDESELAAWEAECERLQGEADFAYSQALIDYQADLAAFEQRLEAARAWVDRIAFCGQVPVNVLGATVGDYIIPVSSQDGGIVGVAKGEDDMTMKEYFKVVGKVIAIEADGRARIIVKVA